MHTFFQDFNFYGFVHRGGDEKKTENTLEAFQYSSDLGFTFMETDVQYTKDGEVVVFHDIDLKRIAGLEKKISELSLKEIKSIDLIGGGKIPTLDDLLSSFKNLRFNIDIKVDSAVEKTVDIIKSQDALNRTCLAAFSSKRLNRIRNLAGKDACTSMGQLEVSKLIMRSWGLPFDKQPGMCAQVPTAQWGIPVVTEGFIEEAHRQDKLVHVWTIDDPEEMHNLIKKSVDGLMTDKPSILKKVLIEQNLF
jgi:glycerophosphoryl diester phosphodiesterase